jgi:hypothetical protein
VFNGRGQEKEKEMEPREGRRFDKGTKLDLEGTEGAQNSRLGLLIGSYMAAKSLYLH